jgi:hypothetical protein
MQGICEEAWRKEKTLNFQGQTGPGMNKSVARRNFVQCLLIFVSPQRGTCFVSFFWRLEFSGGS